MKKTTVQTCEAKIPPLGKKAPFLKSRLWLPLALSFGVHCIFAPLPIILGLLGFLPAFQFDVDQTPIEAVNAIPIEFIDESELNEQPPAEEKPAASPTKKAIPAVAPPSVQVVKKPKRVEKKPKLVEEKKGAPKRTFKNPVAVAGSAGKLADSNANIRLLLRTSAMRTHPLGKRIGNLLQRTPQWSDFFGPADIDPIRDIDNVLVAGPQFRNSSNIVAVVEHHLSKERMDNAFSKLVSRGGKWLDKEGRVAEARADRAPRIFAAPSDTIVAVVPPSARASLKKLTGKESFGRGSPGVVLQAYIVTPWRALRGTTAVLPQSILWAKLEIVQEKNGAATLHLQGEDASQKQAEEHAEWLTNKLLQRSEIDFNQFGPQGAIASMLFGGSRHKLFEPGKFEAKNKLIKGSIVVKQSQLKLLTDILDLVLGPAPAKTAQTITKTPLKLSNPAETTVRTDEKVVTPAPASPPRKLKESDKKAAADTEKLGAKANEQSN